MAHGFLQSFDGSLEVRSAGTAPAGCVHPLAVRVMAEAGIDISNHTPRNVEEFLHEPWDYVITVCGGAEKSCPTFSGKVAHRLHIGFDDPAKFAGDENLVLEGFRRVRDEIRERFYAFYRQEM